MVTSTFRDPGTGKTFSFKHDKGLTSGQLQALAQDKLVEGLNRQGNALTRGLGTGIDLLQQGYGSSLEGIGSTFNLKTLEEIGAGISEEQERQMESRRMLAPQDKGIGSYIAELAGTSAPISGAGLTGAATGAAIGSIVGPVGTAVGGFVGGMSAMLPFFYGQNRERQKEAIERGFRTEIDEGAAALTAVPQAALDSILNKFVVTKVGGLFTKEAVRTGGGVFTRAGRGVARGVVTETPTELGQQVLERYQAGLPMDSDEAMDEYVAAASGGAVLGGLLGGGAGVLSRSDVSQITEAEVDEVDEVGDGSIVKEPTEGEGGLPVFKFTYTDSETKSRVDISVAAQNAEEAVNQAKEQLGNTAVEDSFSTPFLQKPIEPEPAPTPEPEPEAVVEEVQLTESDFVQDEKVTAGAAPVGLKQFDFTDQEAESALPIKEKAKFNRHKSEPIEKGAVRLNLNSKFFKEGVTGPLFVQTLHPISKDGKPQYGKAHSYAKSFTLKNATFSVNPLARAVIGYKVKNKYPMASVDGEVVDTEGSFEGEVLSFNPFRENAFVDSQGRPVKSADEVTVYGSKAYARGNIQYADTTESVSKDELIRLARSGEKYVHPKFHPQGVKVTLSPEQIKQIDSSPELPVIGTEPEVTAEAAPVQTIDFIKGASGNPATNLASKKRRRPGTGQGKNSSLRLEVNGLPIHIGNDPNVGGKSFEGWAEETSAWFTDEEINDAAGWYDSLKDKFTKEFGEERGPKMMLAWLASQQNESPAGGVRNTFRVIDRLTGIKSGKKGGLADAKLEAIFTDTIADKGLDAKLSDFIDAGMGKRTRTFMGDSPDGGMPFVADVHTGRDSGKLDQQTLTRIKRFADSGVLTVNGQPATVEITKTKEKKVKNKVKVEPEEAVLRVGDEEVNLVRDLTGSPSKGEYEGISEWGNNLTDYLNSISWKGRSDWIPAEIQAIGWMRTLRQYGLKESDLESSLIENTFRISAEVDYGLGGKITQIYPDFQKLDDSQKTNITEDVLSFIVPRIQQEMTPSAILRTSEFGIGSWEGNLSPSGNFYLMGSEEASNILANSLAWVTEQAGTMQAVIGKGGKNQRAVALVGLPRNEVSNFVNFIEGLQTGKDKKAAKDAEALKGFSTRAFPGQEGIIVFGLTESKAKGIENTLRKFTKQYQGAESLEIQNFSAVTKFTENNWRDDQNGESYIQEIEQSGGTGDIRQRLLRLREQYGQRLAETGQRVAPEVFGGVTIQSRVDEFVKAGKEYLGEAATEPSDTEVTAQVAPTEPGGTFNQNTLYDFITDNFLPVSRKIGVDIVTNYRIPMARYNASQGVIEYNPTALAQQDQQYITAAMREEMIHAAMSKVILQKAKGKKEGEAFQSFMSSLGKSLTPGQRTAIAEVYSGLETDAQFGAEYSRAAIQQLLYGDVTESFITQGPAFTKLKNLLRSVQSYLAKTFGANVTTDPEAAGIIRASAELLQAADPNARPTNQKIVDQSLAYSVSVNPNAEVTSQEVAESGKPPNEKKLNLNFANRFLIPVSGVLKKIHPELSRLLKDYYSSIHQDVLKYQTRMAPFFKKMKGIKNKKDARRLKQLLFFSPKSLSEDNLTDADKSILDETDKLLRKYGMFNDYNLHIRPLLKIIRQRLVDTGVPVGELYRYMPRKIKDLEKVKSFYNKGLRDSFANFIRDYNASIKEANAQILLFNNATDPEEKKKLQPTKKQYELADQVPIQIGSVKTRAFEAQQWDIFTRTGQFQDKLPGNIKERKIALIPEQILDLYEDPGVAMEAYIYNMVSATANVKLIGRKFTTSTSGTSPEPASALAVLIQKLRSNQEISSEDADGTVPEIFRVILTPQGAENVFAQFARSFGYGTLLVEFTSTLSQLYDLPFIMMDNGVFGTLGAMTGQRINAKDFGIDVDQVSAEFVGDNRSMANAVRLGLKLTGFTKLDQFMKETNMTANYRRYQKLARGYFRNRNTPDSKKFVGELTSMGYSKQEQVQLIADLKKGNRNSAYVRSLIINKLSETQPLTQAEMAMGIVGNPNLRFTVAMKSFMVKQINFAKERILDEFVQGVRTNNKAQVARASKELTKLLLFMLLCGMPVDALKDFLAGRIGYLDDYLFNGIFRVAGVSKYTTYQVRKDGPGEAFIDYLTPVAIQQFADITDALTKVTTGQQAITDSKLVSLAPFSDVINRIFGFQKERERRQLKRRKKEGDRPFLIPVGAI